MRFKGFLFITIALILLTSKASYSQDQPDYKKFQIDITLLGPSKFIKLNDASICGLGFVYKHDFWAINGQILSTSNMIRFKSDSKGYICSDLMFGLRREYKRIELSIFTGIGIAYGRSDSNLDFEISNGIPNFATIGLPIKCKFDYWFSKRLAIGLLGYYNINSVISIYGIGLNLGYRF